MKFNCYQILENAKKRNILYFYIYLILISVWVKIRINLIEITNHVVFGMFITECVQLTRIDQWPQRRQSQQCRPITAAQRSPAA